MLRISDFAEIAQISTSALRYYDEIGIFKPTHVDAATGYRYYAIDQLVRLNRILALKDLGIDLTQIEQLLDNGLSTEAFHGMLRLRQLQLKHDIQAAQEQLARIEARLNIIESGVYGVPEVVIKSVKSMTVVSERTGVAGFVPNRGYANEFIARLRRHHIKPDGSTHYLYHRLPDNFEVEVAIPIENRPLSPALHVHELPEIPKMAAAVYRGSPYNIIVAYQALGAWIQNNAYTITGLCRKVCLQWEGDLNDYITEIQFPVETQS